MSLPNVQSVNCPICNNNNFEKKYIVNQWSIVQCNNCSFVYTNPRLADNAVIDLYTQNYFHNNSFGYSNYNENPHLKKMNFSKWIKDALPFVEKKQGLEALDVGCAAGFGIEAYNELQINAEGLEIDYNYVNELNERGYHIYNKPLLQNEYSKKYDIISLFDVVEHLTNLDKNFAKLNELLSENGILIIVTPDYNSKQRKIFGNKWFQFKPIEHINYFTVETLTSLAAKHHLELVVHQKSGQFADANFVANRLSKYNFKLATFLFKPIMYLLKFIKRQYYLDAASIYCVFRKK